MDDVGRDEWVVRVTEDPFEPPASGRFEGILRYTDEPIVSTDIQNSPYSCIFDSELTMANGNLVKVFSWYDNEWGFSCRMVDLITYVAERL